MGFVGGADGSLVSYFSSFDKSRLRRWSGSVVPGSATAAAAEAAAAAVPTTEVPADAAGNDAEQSRARRGYSVADATALLQEADELASDSN